MNYLPNTYTESTFEYEIFDPKSRFVFPSSFRIFVGGVVKITDTTHNLHSLKNCIHRKQNSRFVC